MWARNQSSTNDFLMFPRKIRVLGLPVGLADETANRVLLNSDTDADLVPLYAGMVPTDSEKNIYGNTGYGVHRSTYSTINLNDSSQYAFEVHFNSAHQVFSKYYFEFYENSHKDTYQYRPLIGSIRLFSHKTPASTIRVAAGENVTVSESGGVYTVNSTASGSGSGSGGGATTLIGLTDVSDVSASDGQALIYDSSTNQWKPSTLASSAYASGVAFNSTDQGYIMGNGNEVYELVE